MAEIYLDSAKDISPEWSYFHIELAGFWKNNLHNAEMAKKVITSCLAYIDSSEHCKKFSENNFPKIGTFKNKIKNIPIKTNEH